MMACCFGGMCDNKERDCREREREREKYERACFLLSSYMGGSMRSDRDSTVTEYFINFIKKNYENSILI